MTICFTHRNFKSDLNFNNLGLAVLCEILERERERERERDVSSVIIKLKFLLCQNDGVFFYTSAFVMLLPNWLISTFTNYLIYTNFKISWLGRLCRVALLYCCRSDSPQYNALPLSQLIHTSGCRECTPMLFKFQQQKKHVQQKQL